MYRMGSRGTVPFLDRILLVPIIQMLQLIMRIVLESHCTGRGPLRMLLRDALLCDTFHYHLLALPQLANHSTLPRLICDDGVSHPLIRPWLSNDQISRIDLDNILIILRTLGIHHDGDGAIFAILIAVAVSGVENVFYLFGVQGNETEAVGNEFVCENGSVDFDLNKIDSHGWDFSKDGSAEGISESEVYVA